MKLFYTDQFVLPLPAGHRFPMRKYALLREHIEAADWLSGHTLQIPPAASDEQILRVHTGDYLSRVVLGELTPEEVRRLGFPWSKELIERSRRSSGATIEAALSSRADGCGINLAGGTHHAFADRAEGFCIFNDTVIAAEELRFRGLVEQVLVVDLDVHQGNGTASLGQSRPWLYTLSVHSANNYPFTKERSRLDVELPDGTTDEAYLEATSRALDQAWQECQPQQVIYLAGADPYVGDRMGRLALTHTGLLARDRLVLERCAAERVPVAISMAGGYAPDLTELVAIHFGTISLAAEMFRAV